MKLSKALGPSGIVVEMVQASDDKGTSKIFDHAAAINCNARYSLTGSRVSLSASTRVRGMHGKRKSHMF